MLSEQEKRQIYYDRGLELEAYRLSGIVQRFPNHFHEYYVIGYMEGGRRHLWCRNQEYDLAPGDLILFNPRDNHCCAPIDGECLDYWAVNIKPEVMQRAAFELTGQTELPHFTQPVIRQSGAALLLRELCSSIVGLRPKLEKEEAFYFLLEQVLREYSTPYQETEADEIPQKIKELCDYLETHYAENVTLDQLLSMAGCSKSYLLRFFTKQVGVTPYRYLQTVRLERAKRLLEAGTPPVDAAAITGFSDQSHFTHNFKEFIGVTPKQYQRIFAGPPASPVSERRAHE